MAADEEVVPWDDQTGEFISAIDEITNEEASISLKELLLRPEQYANVKDISKKVRDVRDIVSNYFNGLLDNLKDEQDRLQLELESINVQYKKINDVVSAKSTTLKVPYIRPLYVDVNQDLREEIVIEQYNDSLDSLIGKLVSTSTYIADVSDTYKNQKLGSWLFSGGKPYVLTMRRPASMVVMIERSSDLINDRLDSVSIGLGEAQQVPNTTKPSSSKPDPPKRSSKQNQNVQFGIPD